MTEFETSGTVAPDISELEKDGSVRISEEVVASVAIKTIAGIDGVTLATPDFITGIRLGRKTVSAVRVNVSYESKVPDVIVDAYVSVRYGMRLPDVCWDLQETVKQQVEKITGCKIKCVNVYVCNIDFSQVDRTVSDSEQCV